MAEAIVIQVTGEEQKAQEERAAAEERKQVGVAGHRDPNFLERARAAE